MPFRSVLLCLVPLFSLSSETSGSSSKDGSFRRGTRSEQFHCSQQRGLCQFCQAWHAFFPSRHPFTAHEINIVVINSKCTNGMLLYQLTAPYTRCMPSVCSGPSHPHPHPQPCLHHSHAAPRQMCSLQTTVGFQSLQDFRTRMWHCPLSI